jgi:hypothetical protein
MTRDRAQETPEAFPELLPFLDAWDRKAARAAQNGAQPSELGRPVNRLKLDCGWIQIGSLKKTQAHYEFLVRGRADKKAHGLPCGGVIGIELHIETPGDFFDFVDGLRAQLNRLTSASPRSPRRDGSSAIALHSCCPRRCRIRAPSGCSD